MRFGLALGTAAAVIGLAASTAGAATFYVTTGIGSQVTDISASNSPSWTFISDTTYNIFGGAVVAIKYGAGTTLGIKLDLIDFDSHIVGTIAFANVADFILAGGQSDYAKFVFYMNPPYGRSLTPADPYTVRLSLNGDGGGADDSYSIQGLDGGITREADSPDNIVVTLATTTETPEPASALLLAVGLASLGRLRHGKRAARMVTVAA
jgi:hypothetical protein